MFEPHKSHVPAYWEISFKWQDQAPTLHPFWVELSVDYVKCWPPVRNTKRSLSWTVAKASYTLVNFLIYDTEEMELRARLPLSLPPSVSVSLHLCFSLSLSFSLLLSLFWWCWWKLLKQRQIRKFVIKRSQALVWHTISLGFSKLAPSRPAINRVGLTFHH